MSVLAFSATFAKVLPSGRPCLPSGVLFGCVSGLSVVLSGLDNFLLKLHSWI